MLLQQTSRSKACTFHAHTTRLHDKSRPQRKSPSQLPTLRPHPPRLPADPPGPLNRSFYTLSKAHHPDHNQSDPNASRRFVRISEAYNILGNAEARARYDRDVLRLHQRAHQHDHAGPRGSYSSTGPAGSRPASGLSRRRGTFRGPPPSFYRSGGWGSHGARRAAAHEESTGGAGNTTGSSSSSSQSYARDGDGAQHESPNWYTSHSAGGMGPGQDPFGKGSSGADIPHFGRAAQAAHTRTQEWVAARRARNSDGGGSPSEASSDFSQLGGFFAVLGVLGVAVGLPYLVARVSTSGRKEKNQR